MKVQFNLKVTGEVVIELEEIVGHRGKGRRCAVEIDPEYMLRKLLNKSIQGGLPCMFGDVLMESAKVTTAKVMQGELEVTESSDPYDKALMQRIKELEESE